MDAVWRRLTPAGSVALQKLKQFATRLGATVLRPFYPVSDMFRVVRDDGLQVDLHATYRRVKLEREG